MAEDGSSRSPADEDKSFEAKVHEMTFQLEALVHQLETEFRETGSISGRFAAPLHHLRLRIQQLLSRGF